MNHPDIFCFISVVRTGSFSMPAQELMISQQAVSRHIHSLEQKLGFPLFPRSAQSVELSLAGQQLDYFTQAKQQMEAELSLRLHGQGPDGDAVPVSLCPHFAAFAGELDAVCQVLPHMDTPYGIWSADE